MNPPDTSTFMKIPNVLKTDDVKTLSFKLLYALIIFLIFYSIGKLVERGIKQKVKNNKDTKNDLLYDFIAQASFYFIVLIGVIFSLNYLGFNISTILVVLGSVGIAIALAIQSTISQIVAGLIILYFNFFNLNDIIEVNGIKGPVKEFNLLKTIISTAKIETVISNSDFMQHSFINYTKNPNVSTSFSVGISSNNNINYNILLSNIKDKIIAESKYCIDKNNVEIVIDDISSSGTIIKVFVPIKSKEMRNAQFELKKIVRNTISEDNILMLDNSYITLNS
jgi:small-conductance mechanosensitive channel